MRATVVVKELLAEGLRIESLPTPFSATALKWPIMFEKVETGIASSKAPLSATVKAGRIVRSEHIAKDRKWAV